MENNQELVQVEGRTWIRHLRLVLAFVLLLLGIFLSIASKSMGYSEFGSPGPGFFPFWVGLFLAVVAFFWFIAEFKEKINDQVEQDLDPKGIYRMARLLGAMIVLTIFFEPLGYNISILAFMLFLTSTMGKGRITTKIIVSLMSSFGVYLFFEKLLDVPLPNSVIPFLAHLGL